MTACTSWRKTFPSELCALLLLLAPASASAGPQEDARAVVEQTSAEVLGLLAQKQLPRDVRIEKLTEIAERRFDLPLMTGLILGRNRTKLSPQQREDFRKEFERHLTVTYGDSLDRYSNEKVEVVQSRAEPNGDVTVKTRIYGGRAGEGVAVDYRLRAKSDPWRVIDVIIEGVSVVQNFRSQVQEIISNNGVDRLITTLREKNDRKAANPPAQPSQPGPGAG
jgi:phospholipid transport system substrate-binding protein